ncbi:hypothetical protein HK096_007998 [Nowakowskiella sp. JEL0078]|nr:hypothetical protein HK096_007998 [Nowakowskiella sp. JEL0078]
MPTLNIFPFSRGYKRMGKNLDLNEDTDDVYEAKLIGTDDDFLKSESFRKYFAENALEEEFNCLFEIPKEVLIEEGILLSSMTASSSLQSINDPFSQTLAFESELARALNPDFFSFEIDFDDTDDDEIACSHRIPLSILRYKWKIITIDFAITLIGSIIEFTQPRSTIWGAVFVEISSIQFSIIFILVIILDSYYKSCHKECRKARNNERRMNSQSSSIHPNSRQDTLFLSNIAVDSQTITS